MAKHTKKFNNANKIKMTQHVTEILKTNPSEIPCYFCAQNIKLDRQAVVDHLNQFHNKMSVEKRILFYRTLFKEPIDRSRFEVHGLEFVSVDLKNTNKEVMVDPSGSIQAINQSNNEQSLVYLNHSREKVTHIGFCHICKQQKTDLNSHLLSAHAVVAVSDSAFRCRYCKNILTVNEVKTHQKSCSVNHPPQPKRQPTRKQKKNQSVTIQNNHRFEDEKEQDGSTKYAHRYREHGKYGSDAMFDDYSEDSHA